MEGWKHESRREPAKIAVFLAYKAYQHLTAEVNGEGLQEEMVAGSSVSERMRQEVIAVEKQGRGDGWVELARESGVIAYRKKATRHTQREPLLC